MSKINSAVAFNVASIRKAATKNRDGIVEKFNALIRNPTAEAAAEVCVILVASASGLIKVARDLAKAEGNTALAGVLDQLANTPESGAFDQALRAAADREPTP